MFTVSKVLNFLLDPAFQLFVAGLLALIFAKKIGFARWFFILLFFLVSILSTDAVSNTALAVLERLGTKGTNNNENPKKYDYAVILSGLVDLEATNVSGQLEFGSGIERIQTGIELVSQKKTSKLILSGGDGSLNQDLGSEAVLLSDFIKRWGVPSKSILVEPASRNTYENAVKTAAMLKPNDKVLLVTSAFHMLRARGCFMQAGIKFDFMSVDYRSADVLRILKKPSSYIPSSIGMEKMKIVLKEIVGIMVYSFNGYLTFK